MKSKLAGVLAVTPKLSCRNRTWVNQEQCSQHTTLCTCRLHTLATKW
jgi:hypothetical protein